MDTTFQLEGQEFQALNGGMKKIDISGLKQAYDTA